MHNEMNGIVKCKLFREIRRQICINNGIPFLEDECSAPDKRCIGTCPKCDCWLDWVNAHLDILRENGLAINYDGVKQIYEEFLLERKY